MLFRSVSQSRYDGADNKILKLCSGGDATSNRGGLIELIGNEYLTNGGNVNIIAGNGILGKLGFYTSSVERIRLEKGGNLGIGSGAIGTALGKVDISSGNIGLVVGADSNLETRTHNTIKYGRIGSAHYANTEEPLGVIFTASDGSNNIISIGGDTGIMNAATAIYFCTAANTTTLAGTERMRIDSAGNVGIGTNNPTEKLHVTGNIRSSAEVHAGTKVVIASKVEQVYDSVNQSLKFNFL